MSLPVCAEWRALCPDDARSPEDAPMEAYWARPLGDGSWPGIVVLMEVFGVNAHIRDVTERLAAEGFSAVAINYFHRTTRNLELGYDAESLTEGRRHKDQTTATGLLSDVQAALDFLSAQPDVAPKTRMGLLGFCFGGHAAFLAASAPRVGATVSYYGAGIATFRPGGGPPTLTDAPKIHGELLCLFGETDPLIPVEQVEAIEAALRHANVRHDVVRYGDAGHGFHCDARDEYRPDAARDAWARTIRLFQRALRSAPTDV